MKMLSCLLAPLSALFICGASAVTYHGNGETHGTIFAGFNRHTRQAQPVTNTTTVRNDHEYYTSTFHPPGSAEAERLWFDLTAFDESDLEIIPESGLSESFRVYTAHTLPFDFQFYGHTIDLVAVTTGGFLYTSDYLHSQIHLTQYIAPLQADFNPSISSNATVIIHSSSERFTVQWDRIHVTNHEDEGEFTFQVSLFQNGTIHFAYRNIPLPISSITDDEHPVEVGVADSFYVDRPVPPNFILRQVFEYSRIRLPMDNLNFSAYVLEPLPGCVTAQTCESCVVASEQSSFECGWCGRLSRCSDGVDRFRQEWFESGCVTDSTTSCSGTSGNQTPVTPSSPVTPSPQPVTTQSTLASASSTVPTHDTESIAPAPVIQSPDAALSSGAIAGISAGLVIVFILVILIVITVLGILFYGYTHPSSSVGLFMIEHRPKARSLNKSKASYNVDSGKANLTED